jgi:hypothetical protein
VTTFTSTSTSRDREPSGQPAQGIGIETRSEHSRGLRLVDIYAAGWGVLAGQDGKTVWATVRPTPVPM